MGRSTRDGTVAASAGRVAVVHLATGGEEVDLDVAAAVRRMDDGAVDSEPEHHVTGILDQIAGLCRLCGARCRSPDLRTALALQHEPRLTPGVRGEPGAVERDAGL